MNRRIITAAGGLALSALALTGCRDTGPTFAPAAPGWPAGYGTADMEPGLWVAGTRNNPGALPGCRWSIYVDGNPAPVDMGVLAPGSTDPVALADGVRFASSNCGGWHLVSPWQGVS